MEPPIHDRKQVLAETHGWHKDLSDQPLPDAEITWFTDGSSFVEGGQRKAGAAVIDGHNTVWAQALPGGMSTQKGEIVVLTKALKLGEDKKVNIYTDSRYAFTCAWHDLPAGRPPDFRGQRN